MNIHAILNQLAHMKRTIEGLEIYINEYQKTNDKQGTGDGAASAAYKSFSERNGLLPFDSRDMEIELSCKERNQAQANGETKEDVRLIRALEALEPPNESSRIYITTGRRQLKRYPEIWLTPREYADAVEVYKEADINPQRGARALETELKTKKVQGRSTDFISHFNWLTGFILQRLIDEDKKILDRDRSKKYLELAGKQ